MERLMPQDDMCAYEKMMQNAGTWLTVSQLAKKMSVHPDTIRRWAIKGKLKFLRNPANNYRMFLLQELVTTKCGELKE